MKRLTAWLLVCVLLLTGCAPKTDNHGDAGDRTACVAVNFPELNDPELLDYLEQNVYTGLVTELNSENYFVENISAMYVSNEYLEEAAYNTQSNVYFGYTLKELEQQFGDTKFIFTLGEDGTTTVQPWESSEEDAAVYDTAIRNVAIGTGVILVCVTVSVAASAAGAPAVSLIFAASAKTGTVVALSDGVISGVAAGVVTGIWTQDFDQALEAAAAAGSEGFKWGAIGGALTGGVQKTAGLYGASRNGLTMNEAASIQQQSQLPLDFIKNFHSMEEYEVYQKAGLQTAKVNGKWAYTQNIDWEYTKDGITNRQRVQEGKAPLDPTGTPYELHHIGQKADSPLAILSNADHHGNDKILHPKTTDSEIDRAAFAVQKREFWKSLLEQAA